MSATILKCIALILMVIDHTGEFLPDTGLMYHYIGRLSYPIFMYCMLWSLHYTQDRMRYFKRLYVAGVLMAVMNLILNNVIAQPLVHITNDIMIPLLLTGVIVHILEFLRNSYREGVRWLVGFLLLQAVSIPLCILCGDLFGLWGVPNFIAAVLPNVIWCEGGPYFIFMGVLLYFLKESKWKLSAAYILLSAFFLLRSAPEFRYEDIMWHQYQWMQVFALPFLLLYNGKRGRGFKYFFYIFYPLHIAILYLAGNLVCHIE